MSESKGVLESIAASLELAHSKLDMLNKKVSFSDDQIPDRVKAATRGKKRTTTKPAEESSPAQQSEIRNELYTKLKKLIDLIGKEKPRALLEKYGNPVSFSALDPKHYPALLKDVEGMLAVQGKSTIEDEFL